MLNSPKCKLEHLDLSNNQIGGLGGAYIAKALYYNTSLQVLKLRLNPLGNDGAFVIAYALQSVDRTNSLRARLDNLKLGEPSSTAPEHVASTVEVKLPKATKSIASSNEAVDKLPPFQYLDMACTGIGPSAFEQFSSLIEKDCIECLDLTCNNFTLTGDAETQAFAVAAAAAATALGSSNGQASITAAALSAERASIADGLGKTIWKGVNSCQVHLSSFITLSLV